MTFLDSAQAFQTAPQATGGTVSSIFPTQPSVQLPTAAQQQNVHQQTSQALEQKMQLSQHAQDQFESENARYRQAQERMIGAEGASLQELQDAQHHQPQMKETSLWEQFGSPGFVLAMVASAFSARPMNAALNGAAGAMNAINQGNLAEYNRQFEQWKTNTELVLKRQKVEHEMYEDIAHLADRKLVEWRARATAIATQFDDKRTLALIENGMDADVLKNQEGKAKLADDLQKNYDAQVKNKLRMDIINADPRMKSGDAAQMAAAVHDAEAAVEGRSSSLQTQQSDLIRSRSIELMQQHPDWSPTQAQIEAAKEVVPAFKAPSTGGDYAQRMSAARQMYPGDDTPENIQKREDWIAETKSKEKGAAGGVATLTDDAAKVRAELAWKGNYQAAYLGMARNAANTGKIANELAKIGDREGMTAEQQAEHINQAMVAFLGEKSGMTSVARQAAGVVGAAYRATLTIPRVEEASDKVNRTKYKDVNKIILAGKERTGDEAVVQYGIALQTLITNYAQAVAPGRGTTTDTARREASERLQEAWSKGQIKAAIKQLRLELSSEIEGAYESMHGWETQTPPNIAPTTTTPEGYVIRRIN